jgi:hypothetical protein
MQLTQNLDRFKKELTDAQVGFICHSHVSSLLELPTTFFPPVLQS